MKNQIYTIGYSGRSPDELKQIVGDGILLDIRMSPRSRKPGFSQKSLAAAFGESYQWFPEFGNKDYNSGGMSINQPLRGWRRLRQLCKTTDRPIFLMCACADPEHCHRAEVARLLRLFRYKVVEWVDSRAGSG